MGRVLDHLRDIGDMSRTDFSKNTLNDPDDTPNKPVSLIASCKTKV